MAVLSVLVRSLALAGVLSASFGCGAGAPPTHQLTKAEAAVRAAEVVDAEDTPKAALHLKMARDHIANAQDLMADHEYEDARLVLQRAEVDADLAIVLAKESAAKDDAERAMQKVQELKREMN